MSNKLIINGHLLFVSCDEPSYLSNQQQHVAVRPESTTPRSLSAQLKGPHRWLAVRLVRLFPVARAMYERVKQEHEVVDYLDLLIKLRNLLRDSPTAQDLLKRSIC